MRKSSNTWAEFSSNKFLLPRRGNFMWIVTQKAPPPLPPRGENYRTKFSSIYARETLYPCIINRDVLLRIIFLAKKLGLELTVGVRLEVLCHTYVSPSYRMYLHGSVPTTHALPGLQDRRAAQGMISGTTMLQESEIGQEKL